MRAMLAFVLLGAWVCTSDAETTDLDRPTSIQDCAARLPPGNVYSLTIVITADTSKGPPVLSARTDLDTSSEMDMVTARAAAEFQDCANQFVAG
jgi:hypothetical protein